MAVQVGVDFCEILVDEVEETSAHEPFLAKTNVAINVEIKQTTGKITQ